MAAPSPGRLGARTRPDPSTWMSSNKPLGHVRLHHFKIVTKPIAIATWRLATRPAASSTAAAGPSSTHLICGCFGNDLLVNTAAALGAVVLIPIWFVWTGLLFVSARSGALTDLGRRRATFSTGLRG